VTAMAAAVPRAVTRTHVADLFFFATFFCVTFEKVHWNVAGTVGIADVLTILFLAAFALESRGRTPRTTAVLTGFFVAFMLVYLLGFYNLETRQALDQYTKGMVKFGLHFVFLACAVTFLARRGERFYWRTIGWFAAGLLANAVYGVLQLLAARAGHNLDHTVLSPLTGGASSINIYGSVNGASVYRPNALTGDPNHLGIMLDVPLLVLTPVYLRLGRGHRLRWPLGLTLAFLLLVLVATLSRSGALGLIVGLLVLAIPYRRFIWSRALVVPLAAVALVLAYVVHSRRHFFSVVIASRLQTGGKSTSAHFAVYDFIPHVLHTHPLLGLGLNTFSVYYEFVTGKTNWGPHSYWVALVVETGLVGALLFLVFLRYVFLRLRAARILGRRRADRRVLPLAWGMTAALAGTMAANFFYLTMQFYYFYAFVALALALSVVFVGEHAGADEKRRSYR
jgi:O-antigen ligase